MGTGQAVKDSARFHLHSSTPNLTKGKMADYFTNFSLVLKLANEGKRYQRCGVGSEGKVAFFLSALNPGETSSWQAEALEPGCSSSRANDGGRQ